MSEQLHADRNSAMNRNVILGRREVGAQRAAAFRRLAVIFVLAVCAVPTVSLAQVPPRFYWKTLMGTNGVPVIYMSMSGNANPLDPARLVTANTQFDAELFIAGYAKMFPLFKRSAMVAILQPMGRIDSETTAAGLSTNQQASGYGDPMIEFAINLVGPPPIMNIPDLLRYEPGFSLDLIVDVAFPIGEYDANESLNLGQNRWFGRVGTPIVWQFGPWVPGRRTTLELIPSLWVFGDNDDLGGTTLETDPMFQAEAHLTRDFTETLWGSLDATWITGGESTVLGVTSESLDNLGVGFTLGYPLSENLQLTAGYMSSVSDSAPTDLHMDVFRFSLVYGWHRMIEGMGRLGAE